MAARPLSARVCKQPASCPIRRFGVGELPEVSVGRYIFTMRQRLIGSVFLAATVVVGSLVSGAAAAAPGAQRSTYIVVFKNGVNAQAEAAQLRGQGHSVRFVYENVFAGVAVDLPVAAARGLANNPNVVSVEPDSVMTIDATQNSATWGLDRSDQRDLPLSTSFTYPNSAGTGVTAYIIDTGILTSHSEFTNRVGSGYTAITDGRGTTDCNGHGTHVAGTVAGTTYGLAKSARVVPVRVLDCNGSGYMSGVVAGVDWVAANAVKPAVANMSLGGGASSSLDTAVANLHNKGVTVVVAAGNSSADACTSSPARAPLAITVGATDSADAQAWFSNYGSCLDIYAPGVGITSAWIGSSTATNTISGTSMATPHVVGAAALALGLNPKMCSSQVRDVLVNASTPDKVTSIGTGSPNKLLFVDSTAATTSVVITSTSPLPPAAQGSSYSTSLQACGGTGVNHTWTTTSALPSGLTLSSSGVISGTPTVAGSFSLLVTATAGTQSAQATFTIVVQPTLSITTSTLPAGRRSYAYSATLAATGGTGTYAWSATGLPKGLTISTSGTISGKPTTTCTCAVTVTVMSGIQTVSKQFTIKVT